MNNSYGSDKIECGVDEAGAGCLAGPVFASAVVLPNDLSEIKDDNGKELDLTLLRDSKTLSERQRYKAKEIIEHIALDYAVGVIYEKEIDKINILNARIKAMHVAIDNLNIEPELILVDGTIFKPYKEKRYRTKENEGIYRYSECVEYKCFKKGDGLYKSIACASIIAKIARDEYMKKIHEEFPMYNWIKNKGYGTKAHYEALKKYGKTKYHRDSFNLHI